MTGIVLFISIVKRSMKSFTTTLILLGLAWISLAYNIDESCNCVKNNLILAVDEAIAVLDWSYTVAYACAALDPDQLLDCRNVERRGNLVQALFGDASGTTYLKIGGIFMSYVIC